MCDLTHRRKMEINYMVSRLNMPSDVLLWCFLVEAKEKTRSACLGL
jgi:hypothetical protein